LTVARLLAGSIASHGADSRSNELRHEGRPRKTRNTRQSAPWYRRQSSGGLGDVFYLILAFRVFRVFRGFFPWQPHFDTRRVCRQAFLRGEQANVGGDFCKALGSEAQDADPPQEVIR